MNSNVGREVRAHVTERFGFVDDDVHPGRYRRAVDAQHQLVITDDSWDLGKNGGHSTANLQFQVARRDINELWKELLNPDIGLWWPTVKVNRLLFDGNSRLGAVRVAAEVAEYCDEWVLKFIEEAPVLSYVHEMFEAALPIRPLWQATRIARMLDTLLEGEWSEIAEEEFFPDQITTVKQEAIRAWVVEHPDGVERDVHGEVYESLSSGGEIEVLNAVLFPIGVPSSEQFAMLAASGFNWFPETQVFRKVAEGEPGASDRPWLEPGWRKST